MAAITDWTQLVQFFRQDISNQTVPVFKGVPTASTVGRIFSTWLQAPQAGVAPSTAVATTRATTGSYPFDTMKNAGTGQLYCVGGQMGGMSVGSGTSFYQIILCDRLSHQGGLSGVTTGAQTTNLPTAALTRYTDGVGVHAALEIYTAIGGTATTFTASYTNETGTSGRTTQTMAIGGTTNGQTAGTFLPLPLQTGDSGVRAVANVNIAATTGTAGNFGITLYKPLIAFHGTSLDSTNIMESVTSGLMLGGFPEILDDACLFFIIRTTSSNSGNIAGVLHFAEV